jgi:hypothetical protein
MGWLYQIVPTLGGLGRRVDRVAPDGNRGSESGSLGFRLASNGQQGLIAAASSSLECVVFSDAHPLLKVLCYRALTNGVLASLCSPRMEDDIHQRDLA